MGVVYLDGGSWEGVQPDDLHACGSFALIGRAARACNAALHAGGDSKPVGGATTVSRLYATKLRDKVPRESRVVLDRLAVLLLRVPRGAARDAAEGEALAILVGD